MSKSNIRKKMRKYLSNVHKIGGAHLQYVNSHYANFRNLKYPTRVYPQYLLIDWQGSSRPKERTASQDRHTEMKVDFG